MAPHLGRHVLRGAHLQGAQRSRAEQEDRRGVSESWPVCREQEESRLCWASPSTGPQLLCHHASALRAAAHRPTLHRALQLPTPPRADTAESTLPSAHLAPLHPPSTPRTPQHPGPVHDPSCSHSHSHPRHARTLHLLVGPPPTEPRFALPPPPPPSPAPRPSAQATPTHIHSAEHAQHLLADPQVADAQDALLPEQQVLRLHVAVEDVVAVEVLRTGPGGVGGEGGWGAAEPPSG